MAKKASKAKKSRLPRAFGLSREVYGTDEYLFPAQNNRKGVFTFHL